MSKVKFKDRKKCTVASGTLHDKYTGKKINWKVKSGSVDIDHVVALKNSWISGAQKLSQAQRQALANDPLNLIAADASANRQKGDKNAAEWPPRNKSFRLPVRRHPDQRQEKIRAVGNQSRKERDDQGSQYLPQPEGREGYGNQARRKPEEGGAQEVGFDREGHRSSRFLLQEGR
ncbi:HNH endonuclease family protein [Glutamicibacter halophytocola]|uniref:HNH endonuclease family protein n=1 Tax=Glutamicibacter halophytocola TaxID=1933880 RepID=UPI00321A643A